MPLTYARNRAIYFIEALRHRRAFAPPPPQPWRLPTQAVAPCEHPEVSGLWVLRNMLSDSDVGDVRALVEHSLPTTQRSGGPHVALAAAEREVTTLRDRHEACDLNLRFQMAEQLRAALSALDAFRIIAEHAGPPVPPRRSGTQWEWYEYEPGRRLAPVLVEEETVARALELGLEEFEVFDKSHPREWLSLQQLLCHENERVVRESKS